MISLDQYILEQENDKAKNKTYVNMILLDSDEEHVLVLRRANYMRKFRGMWGFPGGSLDANDKDAMHGAMRELMEETGIELTFNEQRHCKRYDVITNKDGSKSEYYITSLDDDHDIEVNISREHAAYEWYGQSTKENNRKWMPDIFQIIQKVLD